MKSDLPRLMRERNLDAIVVNGPDGLSNGNAQYNYLIYPARDITGTVIVTKDGAMHLLHRNMERDEAAHSGLNLIGYESYQFPEIVKQMGGDRLGAQVELLRRVLADCGVKDGARIGIYGAEQQNMALAFMDRLRREEHYEIVAEYENDVISNARETKDVVEAEAIRLSARITGEVMDALQHWISGHRVLQNTLYKLDGSPLTIADAKRFLRLACVERELEEDHTIFAIGRDAGVPHSRGNGADALVLGKTIIFDIFPRHAGYFADITRTWCLGYAPDHIAKAHEDVKHVHDAVEARWMSEGAGQLAHDYHHFACELFAARGYPTQLENYAAQEGYVHGLGHGFGFGVHEAPSMSLRGNRPDEWFKPGTIICNEPGLYFPDDPRGGWGVRIEDDYWFDLDGKCSKLSFVDEALVVPMRNT